jgi:hypothetical protein
MATSAGHAQQGEDLREAAQNPIADLISVPSQNNTNFDIGHTDNTLACHVLSANLVRSRLWKRTQFCEASIL